MVSAHTRWFRFEIPQIEIPQTEILATEIPQTEILATEILLTEILATEILLTDMLLSEMLRRRSRQPSGQPARWSLISSTPGGQAKWIGSAVPGCCTPTPARRRRWETGGRGC